METVVERISLCSSSSKVSKFVGAERPERRGGKIGQIKHDIIPLYTAEAGRRMFGSRASMESENAKDAWRLCGADRRSAMAHEGVGEREKSPKDSVK